MLQILQPVTALNARELLAGIRPRNVIQQTMPFSRFSHGSVHDESEFTHRPAGGVSRERQYVLPDKQHRLRHRTEFLIFGCTTRAILESTSPHIWSLHASGWDIRLNRRLATSQG